MKVTLYMAMSLNGIIANEDGDEDFLSHDNWEVFCDLAKAHRNFVIGRRTYDEVGSWGPDYNFKVLQGVRKVVLSQHHDLSVDKDFTVLSSPEEAVSVLREEGLEDILVAGGGATNTAFIAANLLDEIILNIEPVLVGKGIPVFRAGDFEKRLKLQEIKQLGEIAQLRYKVLR